MTRPARFVDLVRQDRFSGVLLRGYDRISWRRAQPWAGHELWLGAQSAVFERVSNLDGGRQHLRVRNWDERRRRELRTDQTRANADSRTTEGQRSRATQQVRDAGRKIAFGQ